MTFTIPNEADAFNAKQAEVDKVDLDIIVSAIKGNAVWAGCEVTAQGTPDMTCAVAAGAVLVDSVSKEVTAGNVTIGTADATNPRFDLVVATSAGAKAVRAGTAAASPVFPTLTAGDIVLAAVYVPANDTAIASNQIVDKRVFTQGPAIARKTASETVNNSSTFQDDDDLQIFLPASCNFRVKENIIYSSGTTPDFKFTHIAPTGSTGGISSACLDVGVTGAFGDMRSQTDVALTGATGLTAGGSGFTNSAKADGEVTTSTTPGIFKVQWAQVTPDVSDTIVRVGSFLEFYKIG